MKQYIIAVATRKGVRFIAKIDSKKQFTKKPHKARKYPCNRQASLAAAGLFSDLDLIATVVHLPPSKHISPFYKAMCEMSLLARALEVCSEFVQIERTVYGVRRDGELIEIEKPIEKYFGYTGETQEQCMAVPGSSFDTGPYRISMERMVVTDCLMADVQDCLKATNQAEVAVWDRVE